MTALEPAISAATANLQSDAERGVVNCAAYARGQRVGDVPLADIRRVLQQTDGFIWIGLFEPDESVLRHLQRELGLHDLAIEDAHRAHQRPKFEQYADSLFVVLRTAGGVRTDEDDDGLQLGETHIFIGRRYVVTVRHGSERSHADLRSRCEATPHLLASGPGFVLYALIDFLVDQYFPIVDTLEDQVDDVEDLLVGEGAVAGETVSRETLSNVFGLKRDLLSVKRAVAPLVDVCNRLMRSDLDLIPEDTRPYYRDIYDHVLRLNEKVDTLRELLRAAFEVNLSMITVEQNRDMRRMAALSVEQNRETRRLAAWAAIIAVPTMIAGVYGMNFQFMPELGWDYGYYLALGIMATACIVLYVGFRRSGWL